MTRKSRAQLATIFATNGAQEIDAADMRDLVDSLPIVGPQNAQTGTEYEFVLSDKDNGVTLTNASPIVATIPPDVFQTGDVLSVTRGGAGLVTFATGAGVTIRKPTGIVPNRSMGAVARLTSDATTQNLTTEAAISFTNPAFRDTDSFWSSGALDRLTIPASLGIKEIQASAQINISSTTADTGRSVRIAHYNSSNAVQSIVGLLDTEGSVTAGILATAGRFRVTDGDYIRMLGKQETDNSITIEGDQDGKTFLSLSVTEIDPVGSIAYQYGVVFARCIAENEWVLYGPALG